MALLKVLNNKIVVKKNETKKTTAGGILLLTTDEQGFQATVVMASEGYYVKGNFHKINVRKGDKVLLPKGAGTEVELDGEKILFIREEDIMAVIDE